MRPKTAPALDFRTFRLATKPASASILDQDLQAHQGDAAVQKSQVDGACIDGNSVAAGSGAACVLSMIADSTSAAQASDAAAPVQSLAQRQPVENASSTSAVGKPVHDRLYNAAIESQRRKAAFAQAFVETETSNVMAPTPKPNHVQAPERLASLPRPASIGDLRPVATAVLQCCNLLPPALYSATSKAVSCNIYTCRGLAFWLTVPSSAKGICCVQTLHSNTSADTFDVSVSQPDPVATTTKAAGKKQREEFIGQAACTFHPVTNWKPQSRPQSPAVGRRSLVSPMDLREWYVYAAICMACNM